ncbi:MAG: ABC transporter permease [Chthoniobacterales bacterium]|nr:ABC transporter permease [Chthoniobacterales bacterium]
MDFDLKSKRLALGERLCAEDVSQSWKLLEELPSGCRVDASRVKLADGAGLAFLWSLNRRHGAQIEGLRTEVAALLKPFDDLPSDPADAPRRDQSLVARMGRITWEFVGDVRQQISFIGEFAITGLHCLKNPGLVRWADMWITAQKAGVDALLVAGMVSFLTGMIMAFQAAVPLKQFGVDIFVVNLVALALLRELGPIMTAVVLAGRSGSAFAAEIGTMKVNEEINALQTMGLDPVRFLVLPRVLAGFLVTPVLTVYANALGVAGGILVMMAQGFPFSALWVQLVSAVGVSDVMTGLIKSFVFGILVAGVGCLRGLQTGKGATAVGESTTRAVVSGIFLIVLVDAVFAGIFYVLKW